MAGKGLRFGPISPSAIHLCIDMQRMFLEDTPWRTPWMGHILPKVVELSEAHPERTIFTRFIPPRQASDMPGTWRRYYERWRDFTLERLDPAMIELPDALRRFTPPAGIFNKKTYSAFSVEGFDALLRQRGVDTLMFTGGETDVCVLATVMGAVDRGYRVILVTDALCSSSDDTHDSTVDLYGNRFSLQVETVTSDALEGW